LERYRLTSTRTTGGALPWLCRHSVRNIERFIVRIITSPIETNRRPGAHLPPLPSVGES
jgi:hypothetical protein